MKVLLTGGGTGGHIYPALALKRQWEERFPETEFLYVGTQNGLESRLVPRSNIPFVTIDIQGFRRSLSLENFITIRKFFSSISDSKKIIREFKPDVVLGTGGYVCGPVVYAAASLGIATVIHEQNSVPGVTNKFLARFVDKIALSFKEAGDYFEKNKNKLAYTGNPRAQEVAGIEKHPVLESFDLDSTKPTVLIFGGSRGALRINNTVTESFDVLKNRDYQTLFVTGEAYYEELTQNDHPVRDTEKFKMVPYIENMPEVFTNVSAVVCRSGATTLAELTSLGLPSILIPSPNVTNDHQTKNALSLVNNEAALMLKESELTKDSFIETIDELMMDTTKRQYMGMQAQKMGMPKASDKLIDLMIVEMNKKG